MSCVKTSLYALKPNHILIAGNWYELLEQDGGLAVTSSSGLTVDKAFYTITRV